MAWVVVFAVLYEGSLLFWGSPALVSRHGEQAYAIPLSVLGQSLVGFAAASLTSSRHNWIEQMASRSLRAIRVVVTVGAMCLIALASAVVASFLGAQGTLDMFAPVRAAIGSLSIAVIAAHIMDYRLAGVVPPAFILFPVVFDPARVPGGEIIGFITARESVSWSTAISLLAIAACLVSLFGGVQSRRSAVRNAPITHE